MNEAATYAAKARGWDPENHVAIFLQGLVAAKRGDMASAIRDLQIAHRQKPGDAMMSSEFVRHYFSAGQEHSESARIAAEASLRVDPLHPLYWASGRASLQRRTKRRGGRSRAPNPPTHGSG